jgi:DNA polymerase III delta prime subunit
MEESKENAANATIPWIEKYRPTQFDDIVMDSVNHHLFSQILEKNYFPHLLFYGHPGTGKTTTIINLIQEYQTRYSRPNRSNVIHLNASDERGIDIIRNQIQSFVKTMNLFESGLKFVILDEVDYMTKNAQQALKYLLQTTNTNVRFCLICNYISKIDESLKNDFIWVRFNQLPKKDIFQFIRNITEKENIVISDEAIENIQEMYNSDIRSMINFLQLNQNLSLNDWNKNVMIMNSILLNKLDKMMHYGHTHQDIIQFIYSISSQYNIDKKYILYSYFNHIIRHYPERINDRFMNMIDKIVHSTDTNIAELLNYFVYSVQLK